MRERGVKQVLMPAGTMGVLRSKDGRDGRVFPGFLASVGGISYRVVDRL